MVFAFSVSICVCICMYVRTYILHFYAFLLLTIFTYACVCSCMCAGAVVCLPVHNFVLYLYLCSSPFCMSICMSMDSQVNVFIIRVYTWVDTLIYAYIHIVNIYVFQFDAHTHMLMYLRSYFSYMIFTYTHV